MNAFGGLKRRLFRSIRTIEILCPLLTVAAAQSSRDPAEQLAGRYYRQFPDALVGGARYRGEDIVEIVPVAPAAAYVRLHLDYYNGHVCALTGIANATGDALSFDDGERFGAHCILTLKRIGPQLRLDDAAGSCSAYCGARGTLSDVRLPYSSKRPIRYLAALRNSAQYRQAMIRWRQGQIQGH